MAWVETESPTRLNGLSHPDILKSIRLKSRERTFVALWWVSQINFSFRWLLGWMSSGKRRGSSRKRSRGGEGSALRIMWNLTIKCLINNVIKWQSMLFLECFFGISILMNLPRICNSKIARRRITFFWFLFYVILSKVQINQIHGFKFLKPQKENKIVGIVKGNKLWL